MSSIASLIAAFLTHLYKYIHEQTHVKQSQKVVFNSPICYEKLIGRKSIMKEVRKKLCKSRFVWITGMGGIGKSHVSRFFAYKYYKKKAIVFEWKGDYKSTLTDSNNIFSANIGETLDERVYIIKNELLKRKRHLIIFDGVDNFSQNDIDFFEQTIKNSSLFVLVTSRLSYNSNDVNLSIMNINECQNLFWYYYCNSQRFRIHKNTTTEYLNAIIKRGGQHCLTIKLLACYAKRNHITIFGLKQNLEKAPQSPIYNLDSKLKIDNTIGYETVFNCISRLIHISFNTDKEKELVSFIALFPDSDISLEFLTNISDNLQNEDIYKLEDESWITVTNNGCYKMHGVIAELIRILLPISKSNHIGLAKKLLSYIEYPMENFSTKENHIYKQFAAQYLFYQENTFFYEKSLLYYYLGRLENDLGNSKIAISYLERAKDILDHLSIDNNIENLYVMIQSEVAESLWFQGEKYLYKAIKTETEAYKKSQSLKDIKYLLYSTTQLTLYLSETNQKNNLIYAKSILQEILKKIDLSCNGYGRVIIMAYIHLGIITFKLGELDDSKRYFETSILFCKSNNFINNIDYAKALSSLSRVYITIYDREPLAKYLYQSIEYIEQAIIIKENIYDINHPTLAVSYHVYASILFKNGNYKFAKKYENRALKIRLQSPEKIEYLASSYYGLANIYFEEPTIFLHYWFKKKAKKYYCKALELYNKIDGFELEKDTCKNRMNF